MEDVALSPDGNSVYFIAGERGRHPIYKVALSGGPAEKIIDDVYASGLQVAPDETLVFSSSSIAAPPEIYRGNAGSVIQLTKINKDVIEPHNLKAAEEMEWTGALGKKIHGFVVKPTDFDASKKYPLVVLIHGGPQGAWNDSWSYRWNPQMFANEGYIVFAPNPRGSTGYGQQFMNEISGDWGGKVYTDLMNGVAEVVRRNKFIDKHSHRRGWSVVRRLHDQLDRRTQQRSARAFQSAR